ncbi:MAG: CBU_0592 family membrane protein [Panacagrimonas sp.]
MIVQGVSLVSACIVLYAFYMQQQGAWQPTERRYLACNCVGTAALTVVAWIGSQWGFVLVEGIWAIVSLRGLIRAQRIHAAAINT